MKTGLAGGILAPGWVFASDCSVGSFAGVVLEPDGCMMAHGDLAAFAFQLLQHNTNGLLKTGSLYHIVYAA